jgi:glucuronate isomerase
MPNNTNRSIAATIQAELSALSLIDPHSHINPHSPSSSNLFDLIGYHYYTELAHSAGLDRETIESKSTDARTKVGLLMDALGRIDNTVQWSWMLSLAKDLYDWEEPFIDASNWERLFDRSVLYGSNPTWTETVLQKSNVEKIFLTNDFDDPLTGFDTQVYIPCLRTDDLVFHIHRTSVRQRLEKVAGCDINSLARLNEALGTLFSHFKAHNAKACAISLPPDFSPVQIDDDSARAALQHLLLEGESADTVNRELLSYWIFWRLAELCNEHALPFDLMIGVIRKVYPTGVYQGQDLYDSRVSLIQYAKLFRSFPKVTFPISVLASATNQELVDYAWIFPNVVTNGHWWYSNTPSFIERDLRARLEAIPRTKQIGYYSDAYKVEFIKPKYGMYVKILSKVLAEDYVVERGWSETKAIEFGRDVLRGNVERIFFANA